MTRDVRTIGDVLDTYSLDDKAKITNAIVHMEHQYKHHMTPAQRDAAGRTAVLRFVTVIHRLKANKKIG